MTASPPGRDWLEIRDVLGTPYPGYVNSREECLRWNWCALVAAAIAAWGDPNDPAMRRAFVVPAIRTYYFEPRLTVGEPEHREFLGSLAEARHLGIVPTESEFY